MATVVVDHRLLDESANVLWHRAVDDGVVAVVMHHLVLCGLDEEVRNIHILGRQGTGFAKDEVGDFAHLLVGIELAYENLVLVVHVVKRVSKRDANCHRQAFWDSDQNDDEGKNQAVNKFARENSSTDVFIDTSLDNQDYNRCNQDSESCP